MDFHCRQWLNAEWTEASLKAQSSDAKDSFVGFWGRQAECDPWTKDYNTTYRDVHKSGYNKKRIKLLLERIGFVDVEIIIQNQELHVRAIKPKYSGERQVGTTLDEIRKDHLNRYIFASKYITKSNAIVTDSACGVGYGSYFLAQNHNTKLIQSLDISTDALNHAKQYFNNEKIEFKIKNLEDLPNSEVLIKYICEAIELSKKKSIKTIASEKKITIDLKSADLPEIFGSFPKQAEKFDTFPPSHRKEYISWITEAKTAATRIKRIDTMMECILDGQSRNWKYEKKK
jgi:uncharacterized protein YdeI (YjbR/CyaY-like superfamily)